MGGYVIQDGEKFRVIASCYKDRGSLDTVREQLKADGLDTAIYEMHAPDTPFEVTAGADQLDRIKVGFKGLSEAQARLSDFVITFDKEQQTPAEGREKVGDIITELKSAGEYIMSRQADGSILESVNNCYNKYIEKLEGLGKSTAQSFIDFSSEMKYTHIDITYEYAMLVKEVSGSG